MATMLWRRMKDATKEEQDRCSRLHICFSHCLMLIDGGVWCRHCDWWKE